MWSRVYVTIGYPSVRLSVLSIDNVDQRRVVGVLLSALSALRTSYRSIR